MKGLTELKEGLISILDEMEKYVHDGEYEMAGKNAKELKRYFDGNVNPWIDEHILKRAGESLAACED